MARNGTKAYVRVLPKCDICTYSPEDVDSVDPPREATHDVKTQDGHWANVCGPHRRSHAQYQELGIGMGQELVVRPDAIRTGDFS